MSNLSWPSAFERTPANERTRYPGGFRVDRATAFENILDELRTWDGVTDVQLDSGLDHQSRNPNMVYANQPEPDDPGVAVRFTKDGEQMAAACDRWNNTRDNAQDLYHYLHETRMQEQRGTVTAQSEYEKLRLPAGTGTVVGQQPPHEVLGVSRDAPEDVVREAYRELAREAHADAGGSTEAMKRLNKAKEMMLS